eukprot:6189706-Pleurochrysis_carterae.AAC.3
MKGEELSSAMHLRCPAMREHTARADAPTRTHVASGSALIDQRISGCRSCSCADQLAATKQWSGAYMSTAKSAHVTSGIHVAPNLRRGIRSTDCAAALFQQDCARLSPAAAAAASRGCACSWPARAHAVAARETSSAPWPRSRRTLAFRMASARTPAPQSA